MASRDSTWTLDVLQAAARPFSNSGARHLLGDVFRATAHNTLHVNIFFRPDPETQWGEHIQTNHLTSITTIKTLLIQTTSLLHGNSTTYFSHLVYLARRSRRHSSGWTSATEKVWIFFSSEILYGTNTHFPLNRYLIHSIYMMWRVVPTCLPVLHRILRPTEKCNPMHADQV